MQTVEPWSEQHCRGVRNDWKRVVLEQRPNHLIGMAMEVNQRAMLAALQQTRPGVQFGWIRPLELPRSFIRSERRQFQIARRAFVRWVGKTFPDEFEERAGFCARERLCSSTQRYPLIQEQLPEFGRQNGKRKESRLGRAARAPGLLHVQGEAETRILLERRKIVALGGRECAVGNAAAGASHQAGDDVLKIGQAHRWRSRIVGALLNSRWIRLWGLSRTAAVFMCALVVLGFERQPASSRSCNPLVTGAHQAFQETWNRSGCNKMELPAVRKPLCKSDFHSMQRMFSGSRKAIRPRSVTLRSISAS